MSRTLEEEAICDKLMRGEKLTHAELTLWLGEPPETFWPRFYESLGLRPRCRNAEERLMDADFERRAHGVGVPSE